MNGFADAPRPTPNVTCHRVGGAGSFSKPESPDALSGAFAERSLGPALSRSRGSPMSVSPVRDEAVQRPTKSNGRECRCTKCNSLLGIQHGGQIHIKYKELSVIGPGPMIVECRRCRTSND